MYIHSVCLWRWAVNTAVVNRIDGGLFTGHDANPRAGPDFFENLTGRVRSGRVREV